MVAELTIHKNVFVKSRTITIVFEKRRINFIKKFFEKTFLGRKQLFHRLKNSVKDKTDSVFADSVIY